MTKREANQQRSLEAFLAKKAEFDALLAVLWGEAAWLADAPAKLKDIADQHFRRGEYSA